MIVHAIDPGTEQSAIVRFSGRGVEYADTVSNDNVIEYVARLGLTAGPRYSQCLVIEDIQSYGMAVGVETFRTVFWSGRFAQAWGGAFHLLGRRDIKQHLCYSARATDANIRQALIDRFGPGKEKAIGKKACPGPLFGVKGHEMAALAVAVTWWDTQIARPNKAPDAPSVGF